MAEENGKGSSNKNYMLLALVSIVAIVAIAGIVVLFMNKATDTKAHSIILRYSSTPALTTATNGKNAAGQAGYDLRKCLDCGDRINAYCPDCLKNQNENSCEQCMSADWDGCRAGCWDCYYDDVTPALQD